MQAICKVPSLVSQETKLRFFTVSNLSPIKKQKRRNQPLARPIPPSCNRRTEKSEGSGFDAKLPWAPHLTCSRLGTTVCTKRMEAKVSGGGGGGGGGGKDLGYAGFPFMIHDN